MCPWQWWRHLSGKWAAIYADTGPATQPMQHRSVWEYQEGSCSVLREEFIIDRAREHLHYRDSRDTKFSGRKWKAGEAVQQADARLQQNTLLGVARGRAGPGRVPSIQLNTVSRNERHKLLQEEVCAPQWRVSGGPVIGQGGNRRWSTKWTGRTFGSGIHRGFRSWFRVYMIFPAHQISLYGARLKHQHSPLFSARKPQTYPDQLLQGTGWRLLPLAARSGPLQRQSGKGLVIIEPPRWWTVPSGLSGQAKTQWLNPRVAQEVSLP